MEEDNENIGLKLNEESISAKHEEDKKENPGNYLFLLFLILEDKEWINLMLFTLLYYIKQLFYRSELIRSSTNSN